MHFTPNTSSCKPLCFHRESAEASVSTGHPSEFTSTGKVVSPPLKTPLGFSKKVKKPTTGKLIAKALASKAKNAKRTAKVVKRRTATFAEPANGEECDEVTEAEPLEPVEPVEAGGSVEIRGESLMDGESHLDTRTPSLHQPPGPHQRPQSTFRTPETSVRGWSEVQELTTLKALRSEALQKQQQPAGSTANAALMGQQTIRGLEMETKLQGMLETST